MRQARRRLKGHEELLKKLVVIAKREAALRAMPILKIEALGAWSHEYEEKSGIVVHVEVQATDQQRFSFWEEISERVDSLRDTLSTEEKDFLTDQISVVVD
ncbi:MAG TPA: hypothetical protein VFU31_16815 [Candidatus Binatia bacterium]|nr:hypothetical protein [Candidatus Binatia bacterium]